MPSSDERPIPRLEIHYRGRQPYLPCWQAMRDFTAGRDRHTPDQLWVLEHPPVYTLGQAGRRGHILAPGDIPIMQTDRGGQVTYHGPGQVIIYVLLDLPRRRLTVRGLVDYLEQAVIDLLATAGLHAYADPKAPGVYVAGEKLAALGLRLHRGRSYHGLALNVDLDLNPFAGIEPCGQAGLTATSLAMLGITWSSVETGRRFAHLLAATLGESAPMEYDRSA